MLLKVDYKSYLHLMFGGKKSPMKVSEYHLKIDNGNVKNANDLVFHIDENQLMYEKGSIKGSEEEKLKILLGR